MKYRCKCGKESSIIWNDVYRKKEQICRKCFSEKQGKLFRTNNVKNYFKDNGCELLEEYKNALIPVQYKCSCGNISHVRFCDFKDGCRCKKCAIANRTGSKHPNWNPNKEEMKLNQSIHARSKSSLQRCLKMCGKKKNKWQLKRTILGYTEAELKKHIFNHPDWNDLKNKHWSIDHIFPVIAFIRSGVLDLKVINSLDNLQPMLFSENVKKSDKYDHEKFKKWLLTKGITI